MRIARSGKDTDAAPMPPVIEAAAFDAAPMPLRQSGGGGGVGVGGGGGGGGGAT